MGSGGQGAGVHGLSSDPNGNGVIGDANTGSAAYGIWGRSTSGFAGFFDGAVRINGSLDVTGTKSALVSMPDGSHKRLYCMEAPESWFEDFGLGELVNGRAEITLDPDFVAVSNSSNYHVFLTEYEDNNSLYVTQRTRTGFGVCAKGTPANGTFSFRVVARRRDVAGARFEKVSLPAKTRSLGLPVTAPAPVPARPVNAIKGSANC